VAPPASFCTDHPTATSPLEPFLPGLVSPGRFSSLHGELLVPKGEVSASVSNCFSGDIHGSSFLFLTRATPLRSGRVVARQRPSFPAAGLRRQAGCGPPPTGARIFRLFYLPCCTLPLATRGPLPCTRAGLPEPMSDNYVEGVFF